MSKKNLDEILAKPVGTLDDYDKSILRARKSYLTDSQKKDYAGFLEEEDPKTKEDATLEVEVSEKALERGEAMSDEEKQEAIKNSVPIKDAKVIEAVPEKKGKKKGKGKKK